MLLYPNFSKKFVIHTDASDLQLGAVILQGNRPIAYYSRKLKSAQRRYTTTEKELLSIVETLKEFKTILLGYKIEVHTDHKNLVHETFLMSSDRVMRWRLIIEEYGPEIFYIPGPKNIVADALSRLPKNDDDKQNLSDNNKNLFVRTKDVSKECPLDVALISKLQREEMKIRTSDLRNNLNINPKYERTVHEGQEVIIFNKKLFVPNKLREQMVNWHHHYLSHPGSTRLAKTIQ